MSELFRIYTFGDFQFDTQDVVLLQGREKLLLNRRSLQVLDLLVSRSGQIISKQQFFDTVWADTFVEDNSLTVAITTLRKVLGDNAAEPKYIETLPRKGYRFLPEVTFAERPLPDGPKRVPILDPKTSEKGFPTTVSKRIILAGAVVCLLLIVASVVLNYSRLSSQQNATTEVRTASIAVMPFDDGEEEDRYISEDLTEAVSHGLGELSSLRVISGNSTGQFKTTPIDPVVIGQALNVGSLLTGRVERSGDTLLVTAEITDVMNGRSLWTRTYDCLAIDLLELRNTIVADLYRFFGENRQLERANFNRCGTADRESYQLFIKGRYYWNQRSNDNLATASQMFQQAIDRDPTFALAYVGLANTYAQYDFKPGKTNAERAALVIGAAEKALEIDQTCAEAYSAIAITQAYHQLDLESATRNLQKSVELSPNYATARHWHAEFLAMQGLFDESLREYSVARSLDPLSFAVMTDEAITRYYLGQPDRAVEELLKIKQLKPDFPRTDLYLHLVYEGKGMYAESLQSFRDAFAHQGRSGEISVARLRAMNALIDGVERRTRESGADGYWRGMLDLLKNFDYTSQKNWYSAKYHARLGESDKAVEFLGAAIAKFEGSVLWIKVSPEFDKLRSDRRFSALMNRVGFRE